MMTDWAQIRESLMTPRMVAFQRLANIHDLMDSLSESLNSLPSFLNCPTCGDPIRTNRTGSRQICSSCGNFYSIQQTSPTNQNSQHRNHLRLPHIDNEPRSVLNLGNLRFNNFRGLLTLPSPVSLYARTNQTTRSHAHSPNQISQGHAHLPNQTILGHALSSNETTLGHTLSPNQRNNNLSPPKTAESESSESSDSSTPTPTPLCFGGRRRPKPQERRLETLTPFSRYRVGSGASLPPISPSQQPRGRRESTGSITGRTASRSEERTQIGNTGNTNEQTWRNGAPAYPKINIERHEFMKQVKLAKESKDFTNLKKFYFETFESYGNINATFKRSSDSEADQIDDLGIRMELVYTVHDLLRELPPIVQSQFMKAVIICQMEERPILHTNKDKVRGLFILLQSPMFLSQSSYNVLAQVLRSITNLTNVDHQLLVAWFKTMEISRFRMVIGFITQFLTVRQFPPPDRSLPPLSSSKWWIPTATKVLAIFYASNYATRPPIIHYTEFYNYALDHLDLMTEYKRWQSPDRSDVFCYCQYPFVLSIVAKRFILTKDAEQQMILVARRSLVARMEQQQPPELGIFFLNINISARKRDLKKKLRVNFEGEPGLDMGGLTKEWFMLLIKQIFKPESQLFVYHPEKRLYWFSMRGEGSLKEYNLIGVLMGLAVYNAIILDVRFPSICYRKLLSPPVVPKNDVFPVGLAKEPSLEDLAEIMPQVAHALKELLQYEGNVEEDMCLTFQVSLEEYGIPQTFNLKENGEMIPVTNENRAEFVRLYLDWILNTAIYEQFRAFYLGFHTVTASNALIMLRPEEVEMLVCGSPNLDLNELRKVTEYDGYDVNHPTIRFFWQVLQEMPVQQQKQFLLFTTGSDRIPVGGMGEMAFKISCWSGQIHMLPQAHTCFNQLVLPPYEDKETLKSKLLIAINNAEGFGLE